MEKAAHADRRSLCGKGSDTDGICEEQERSTSTNYIMHQHNTTQTQHYHWQKPSIKIQIWYNLLQIRRIKEKCTGKIERFLKTYKLHHQKADKQAMRKNEKRKRTVTIWRDIYSRNNNMDYLKTKYKDKFVNIVKNHKQNQQNMTATIK